MKRITPSFISFLILALISVLWIASPAVSADPEVRAELRPETFSIQESATLRITVRNAQGATIRMPDVDGLTFHQRGKSSQVQIVNGAIDSSVVYSYQVEPFREGTFDIPPIAVEVDSKTIETRPLSCTVTGSPTLQQQPSPPDQADTGTAPAFIAFIPAKQSMYRGEVMPVAIKVYFRRGTRVSQLSLPRLQGEGVLVDELSNNPLRSEEIIDNTAYSVLAWHTFITAVKEGAHPLSFELDATIQIPSRKRSPMPGFGSGFFGDDIFGDMFSGYSSKNVRVASEQTTVDVKPLPEPLKPEGFSGAVGAFTFDLDARPTTIEPGEPVTLAMHVTGSGNFASVEAPAISDPGGLKLYTPTAEFIPDQSPHHGTKRFQQAVIITDPSVQEIPPATFSYFDPDTERYHTLSSPPVPLTINRVYVDNGSAAPDHSVQQENVAEQTVSGGAPSLSLVPVKLEPGALVERITPPFLSSWFIVVISASLLCIACLFGFQLYSTVLQTNGEAARKKAFRVRQQETLSLVSGLTPDEPDYPARARKMINDLLVAQQRTDATSVTTAEVETRFGRNSVATELFRLGDGALYGKQESSAGKRRELHDRLLTFISELS